VNVSTIPPESQLDARVVVRSSRIYGRGLFAVEPIGRGAVVEILGGTTISDAEVRHMIRRGERYDGIALDVDLNLKIEPPDWPGIHGNHSCDPNLWMDGPITVVARRDIQAGEELTVDYALHTIALGWSMRCNCRTKRCRGVITGNDWQLPELQTQYRGHFAPAVARHFDSP
jgi:uncharacterized protein